MIKIHEWALARAIIEELLTQYTKNKIKEVTIVLGELQNIDINILKQYIDIILKETELKNLEIDYEIEETILRCRKCGYEWRLKDTNLTEEEKEMIHFIPEAIHSFSNCPKCGSKDIDIIKGRGVKIRLG